MAQLFGDQDRKIFPRWRPFRETLKTGELSSIENAARKNTPIDDLLRLKAQWGKNRTPSFAADVVSAAVALDEPGQAKQEADFLLKAQSVPLPARSLAERILGIATVEPALDINDVLNAQSTRKKIHDIRRRLWDDPHNVIGWTELSFFFAVIGVHDKAISAMENALRLAPHNRYVLRSAARLFVHINHLGRAHELLLTNERTRYDPWLLAAEIAIADARGKPPKFAITGRRTLNSGIDRFHVSELASAIGTLEINASGSTRRGRRFIQDSLEKPSENAVAQAAWADRKFGMIDINGTILRQSPEAKTWDNYMIGNWRRALDASMTWFRDQPFSKHPPIIASYLSALVFQEYESAAKIAGQGLVANAGDPLLLNNLAYSLANQGKISEAVTALKNISLEGLPTEISAPVLATRGLIAYRSGNAIEGRALYMEAVERLNGHQSALLRANLHMAIEELRAGTPQANVVAVASLGITAEVVMPEVVMLRERLRGQFVESRKKEAISDHG